LFRQGINDIHGNRDHPCGVEIDPEKSCSGIEKSFNGVEYYYKRFQISLQYASRHASASRNPDAIGFARTMTYGKFPLAVILCQSMPKLAAKVF
jgi:hypothetical protein